MVRTEDRNSEERELSEFELHQRRYGKRLASLFGLGIGMGILAVILSLLVGGTSEVAEDVTDDTGNVDDAPSDATGDANAVSDAAGNATNAAGELGSNLAQIAKDAAEDSTKAASDAADNATNAAGDAVNSAEEAGSNVVEETEDATSSASDTADDATDTVGEAGSNAVEGTQNATSSAVSGTAISKAVNSLQSGEWGVNQVIAVQPDNPILFDYSSAELSMQDKQTISKLAQQIEQLDSDRVAVKLIGHASKTGNPQSNLILSQYRADVVAEELRNLGVDKTISTEGKSYNDPMTNIPASDARQQRTEVQLVRVK